ncbi:SDR family NAD(P)-dependent oxidoreductase [Streptomyces iranensis]|uniref:NAD(P)-dependent dehydrogenase (Short-subunit alcohol dehydrogenase family) n=1 Tax=Streptomyces iranensis TaxID=576784 RepID=A0A061A5X2_9ACTN|nr:glucose 1-dehydrogenase [Streptomyces iranensis]MBP2063645.1 NAD(P)-dependent dehydrogenase (short-subunit alcohol dehydrogenase family) [Streptomyces iranensis]CDR17764.1 short-chain dehydrogenase/reductase SDR [Streptomyces iranensis]
MRLDGKVAVVTGAGGGIGAAVCHRLAEEGCSVVAADLEGEGIGTVAEETASAPGTVVAVTADVSTDEGNAELVDAARSRFGGLDVFHANAATQIMGGLEQATAEDWDRQFRTNLYGVASGLRHAVPELRRRGGGSLIITASVLGLVGDPDLPAYGAMKGGVRALCRSMATRYGPENIRVNTICPGDVETPMVAEFFAFQDDPEAARAQITERYPLRRFAVPRDVANAALFLASDESGCITGTDILVDGGLLARIY